MHSHLLSTRNEHFWNIRRARGVYMNRKRKAQARKGPFHEPKIDRKLESNVSLPVRPAVRDVIGRSQVTRTWGTMPWVRRGEMERCCAPAFNRPHLDL